MCDSVSFSNRPYSLSDGSLLLRVDVAHRGAWHATQKTSNCDAGHFAPQRLRYAEARKIQEVAMAATKRIGERLARWFKIFHEKNRPPSHYYEHSLYDA
jgi:hypothetical protein